MATGRPLITTNVPGCRETLREGINGYLVPPRDEEALAAKMALFCEHPEQIAPMGKRSRLLAEEHFCVHKVNAAMTGIIEKGLSWGLHSESPGEKYTYKKETEEGKEG
jgi:glycosyltransferase involved in cell wall biosynthesis